MEQIQTIQVACPYCGEPIGLVVDCSGGSQAYVEDCSVCCRPMDVRVEVEGDGAPRVVVHGEDE